MKQFHVSQSCSPKLIKGQLDSPDIQLVYLNSLSNTTAQ